MGLIDSHAHLTFPELRDSVAALLERSSDAGVEQIITVGTDLADACRAVELARRHPSRIRVCAGFHPHEAGKVTDDSLAAMAELWGDPAVVGIGEVGLDYHYDFADRTVQRSIFARQLELAAQRPEPLVVHCRKALDDAIPLLQNHGFTGRRVAFHCFTGTAEDASRIAEQGWRISFTGIVTFKKSKELQEIARVYPADRLMVETDSPYLSPEPVRNRRPNEPAHLAHIARFLADLRCCEYDRLVEQTSQNTGEFFDL